MDEHHIRSVPIAGKNASPYRDARVKEQIDGDIYIFTKQWKITLIKEIFNEEYR